MRRSLSLSVIQEWPEEPWSSCRWFQWIHVQRLSKPSPASEGRSTKGNPCLSTHLPPWGSVLQFRWPYRFSDDIWCQVCFGEWEGSKDTLHFHRGSHLLKNRGAYCPRHRSMQRLVLGPGTFQPKLQIRHASRSEQPVYRDQAAPWKKRVKLLDLYQSSFSDPSSHVKRPGSPLSHNWDIDQPGPSVRSSSHREIVYSTCRLCHRSQGRRRDHRSSSPSSRRCTNSQAYCYPLSFWAL